MFIEGLPLAGGNPGIISPGKVRINRLNKHYLSQRISNI